MDACLHSTELDVRWGDLDAFNHVNNATYLDYIQEARLRWMVTLDEGWHDADVHPVVVNTTCNYRSPIVWPARLRIELGIAKAGGSSLTLWHRLVDAANPETLYCDGHVVMVWISRASGRSVPLPDAVRNALPAAPQDQVSG
jgi:acyl-CoA thioester hydrolase